MCAALTLKLSRPCALFRSAFVHYKKTFNVFTSHLPVPVHFSVALLLRTGVCRSAVYWADRARQLGLCMDGSIATQAACVTALSIAATLSRRPASAPRPRLHADLASARPPRHSRRTAAGRRSGSRRPRRLPRAGLRGRRRLRPPRPPPAAQVLTVPGSGSGLAPRAAFKAVGVHLG